MPLDRYRRPRMIILSPLATAQEAARAMADHHVGSVLVGDEKHLVGIVTDRDLALEVVAGDLAPRETVLRDVMSESLSTVDIGASVEDALRIMRERSCRRVPVTERGRPVGLVTLDDVLLDGPVERDVRLVVAAQLDAGVPSAEGASLAEEPAVSEPAPAQTARRSRRAEQRRAARAETAYARLLRAVERQTGLHERDRADRALHAVLRGICRRLTPDEARHLIAQLPSKLHPDLAKHCVGPDKHVTTQSIAADLQAKLCVDTDGAIEILYAVCEAVADAVSAGEIESVRGQLPSSMKELFPPLPYRRTG